MDNLKDAIWIEWRKAVRSRVPLYTGLGFLLIPLACGLLMFIYKDPEFARQAGLISAKANLMGGTADWPTYLNMMAQAVAIGGLMLFSLILSWVFGREFADGTLKDWLAVPVARTTVLLAKFWVAGVWSAGMIGLVVLIGFGLGGLIGLPQGAPAVFQRGGAVLLVTAALTLAVVTPFALLASIGRGYLLPLGLAMLTVALANVLAVMGWGGLFPWSIPALYAGTGGQGVELGPASFWIVALTGLAGVAATDLWWRTVDQSR